MEAVDAADHRRLATARGPDDRGHLIGRQVKIDSLDPFGPAVEGAQAAHMHARSRPARSGGGLLLICLHTRHADGCGMSLSRHLLPQPSLLSGIGHGHPCTCTLAEYPED